MCKDDRYFAYQIPKGLLLLQVVIGCILIICGMGLIVSDFGRLSLADWLPPLVLIAIGLFLPIETALRIRRQTRNQLRVVLTETSLAVPGLVPVVSDSCVPYDQITGVTEIGSPGLFRNHMILVSHHKGKTRIACKWLAEAGAAVEIMRLLRERLEAYSVAFEYRETFGIRWSKIQFSIRSILLVTTAVAVILGLGMYIHPRPQWSDFSVLCFTLTGCILPLLLAFTAYKPVRVFGISYLFGAYIELIAIFTFISISLRPPATLPLLQQGRYPLIIPVMRMLVAMGWEKPNPIIIISKTGMWLAVFISGMLSGTAVLLIGSTATWVASRRRRGDG